MYLDLVSLSSIVIGMLSILTSHPRRKLLKLHFFFCFCTFILFILFFETAFLCVLLAFVVAVCSFALICKVSVTGLGIQLSGKVFAWYT